MPSNKNKKLLYSYDNSHIFKYSSFSVKGKEKLFLNILTEYDSICDKKYDLNKIKNIINKIIEEKLKLNKLTPTQMNPLLIKFNQFVAGLTKNEFPNIEKLRNLSGYKYPKIYKIKIDSKEKSNDNKEKSNDNKEIILGKRKRNEVSYITSNRKLRTKKNVITNENTSSNLVIMRNNNEIKENAELLMNFYEMVKNNESG